MMLMGKRMTGWGVACHGVSTVHQESDLQNNPACYCRPTVEKTEAQGGEDTCVRPHSR